MNRALRHLLIATAIAIGLSATGHAQAPKRAPIVSPEVHSDGKVTFPLLAPQAVKVVVISGEMQPTLKTPSSALTKDETGIWTATEGPFAPGIYDYSFNI